MPGRSNVFRHNEWRSAFLHTDETILAEVLRERIRERGPLSFAEFMEQALYHPVHGYYSSGRAAIGREGDYFTSVSVGPLFGRLLAAQFAEMWATLDRPNEFTIVEQGAHDGAFARDVLEATARHHPDLSAALRYRIVEPFPVLQARQAETLSDFVEKVSWHSAVAELPAFHGAHFSNELIDAMPVHLVRSSGAAWSERHVTANADGFAFIDLPVSNPALTEHLRTVTGPLPVGYETEVNLCALEWLGEVSTKLERGFILAADYGFVREKFYAPERTAGTLRTRARHRVLPSPLMQPGEADITAHVEWTSLAERAEALSLRVAGFADQHHFITGLLAGELGQEFGPQCDAKTRRALQTLLHPNFLGMNFQLLALSKGFDAPPALSGFRFARDTRGALALANECCSRPPGLA